MRLSALLPLPLPLPLPLLVCGLIPALAAQEPFHTLRGTVRDTAGRPLEGAGVQIGERRAVTNPQGMFRIDSLKPGSYVIAIRLPGHTPIRQRLTLTERAPEELSYTLLPSAYTLPPVVTITRRTGIYGTVGTPDQKPLAGVFIQAAGANGGEITTGPDGKFAFPEAHRGPYLVRFARDGYAERRMLLELKPGEGREVAIQLVPSARSPSRADEWALEGLHQRIAFGLSRERLPPSELARYGSQGLCDIPRIRSEIGRAADLTTVIINGVTAYENFPVFGLCAWRADEVDLVEVGRDICADVTQTLTAALPRPAWCSGRTRTVSRSLVPGGRGTQYRPASSSYVVIWEARP
ncbi:MAG: carboxypeptidase-like regulatory domain-containing protein [Gemmatimonadales bacterium]